MDERSILTPARESQSVLQSLGPTNQIVDTFYFVTSTSSNQHSHGRSWTWLSQEERKKELTCCLKIINQPTKGPFAAAGYAWIAYQTSGLPQQKVQLVVADGKQDLECQDQAA
jgi:hypothetical protein